ncbi:MAG: hypothetical protein KIS96_04770 [Bauldia sp.]|nr:hypothetical protein [Bauldia sp.]
MFRFPKIFTRVALAASVVLVPLAAANAQPGDVPNNIAIPAPVPVPVPVPVTTFAGSWQINQPIYGPYWVSFRLSQYGGGSYQVQGGGLYCNGGLTWYQSGNQAVIQLQYTNCGGGIGWSADRMVCQFTNTYSYQQQYDPRLGAGNAGPANIAVPNVAIPVPTPPPSANQILCTYQPAVAGYQPISVLANRTAY